MERVLMILSPYILAVLMINHVSIYTPTAQSTRLSELLLNINDTVITI